MAWIETVSDVEATGTLAQFYAEACRRAGRVFNILRLQSINTAVLEASTQLYLSIMHGDSPLTRAQREMLAVIVSRSNNCHY